MSQTHTHAHTHTHTPPSTEMLSWFHSPHRACQTDLLSLKAYHAYITLNYTAGLIYSMAVRRAGWAGVVTNTGKENESKILRYHSFCQCTSFFSAGILRYLHRSVSYRLGGAGANVSSRNLPLLPLAWMRSLLLWLKMNQPLCLLAVFEVESSKIWGVERSQTKPTAPYAQSPSSLSNAKHTHTAARPSNPLPPNIIPHFLVSFLLLSFHLGLCLLTVVCQFVNGLACFKIPRWHNKVGIVWLAATQWVYLSKGMALHCWLNALLDKERRRRRRRQRRWGVRWFSGTALALILHDKILDIVSSTCSVVVRPDLMMLTTAWVCVWCFAVGGGYRVQCKGRGIYIYIFC